MSFLAYLGGSNLNTFARRITKQNKQGVKVSASKLPRTFKNQSDINKEIASYSRLIDMIVDQRLDADVTIKLHQFGFYASPDICTESVRKIVAYAADKNIFIWLDAMLHDEIDFRVEFIQLLLKDAPNVGIAIQAYHTQANDYVTDLIKNGVQNIRLVKGIYADSQFASWDEVTTNYKSILTNHLGAIDRFAIATHDSDLITHAKTLITQRTCKDKIEFQHMAGVNDPQIVALAKEGYVTRVYMPYGNVITYLLDDWRRLDWKRGLQRAVGRKTIS